MRNEMMDLNMAEGWQDICDKIETEGQGYKAAIPGHWKQGRTAYGGLTAALMFEASQRKLADLPPLRSALVNFVGPVTGTPTLTAELLRRGRNVTNVSARADVGEHCVGRADFLFGTSRASEVHVDFPAPDAPTPDSCEPLTPEAAKSMVPQFFHNFDTRLIAGERPMMGQEGYIRTWSRHMNPASREGTGSLLCLADVLPPAALPLVRKMVPVSSMSWIVNILSDVPETDEGWWQVESRLTAARGGYSTQVMRIWNTAGDLVVEGMQSIAIFG